MSRHTKLDSKAVKNALAAHVTITAAAEALGIHERTLRRWLDGHPGLRVARRASLKRATRSLRPSQPRKETS